MDLTVRQEQCGGVTPFIIDTLLLARPSHWFQTHHHYHTLLCQVPLAGWGWRDTFAITGEKKDLVPQQAHLLNGRGKGGWSIPHSLFERGRRVRDLSSPSAAHEGPCTCGLGRCSGATGTVCADFLKAGLLSFFSARPRISPAASRSGLVGQRGEGGVSGHPPPTMSTTGFAPGFEFGLFLRLHL